MFNRPPKELSEHKKLSWSLSKFLFSVFQVIMAANMLRDSGNNMFREEGAQYRKWESTNIEIFMQKMSLSQHWYDCIDYLCADKVPVVKPRTKVCIHCDHVLTM